MRRTGRSRRAGTAAGPAAPLLWCLAVCALAAGPLSAAPTTADAAATVERLLGPARASLAEAERWGAGGRLPVQHRAVTDGLASLAARVTADPEAAAAGALAAEIQTLERQARRLADYALFIHALRSEKREWEAVALRHEQDLRDIARAAGLEVDASRGGAEATRRLIDALGAQRLRTQRQIDSLLVVLRVQREGCRLEVAERDSLVAGLRRQLSQLEQRLWGAELQVGRAEATRTHAEALQQRVKELGEEFRKLGCEVLLSPAGDVIMRLSGLAFASGSAELTADMSPVLDKLVATVALFPGRQLRVEGHTDNTGSRAANMRLSRGRADAVAALLRERLKLPEAAVDVVGHGPDRPVAPNARPEGRQQNRRIDVHILAAEAEGP